MVVGFGMPISSQLCSTVAASCYRYSLLRTVSVPDFRHLYIMWQCRLRAGFSQFPTNGTYQRVVCSMLAGGFRREIMPLVYMPCWCPPVAFRLYIPTNVAGCNRFLSLGTGCRGLFRYIVMAGLGNAFCPCFSTPGTGVCFDSLIAAGRRRCYPAGIPCASVSTFRFCLVLCWLRRCPCGRLRWLCLGHCLLLCRRWLRCP